MFVLLTVLAALAGCTRAASDHPERVAIYYWEKWSGFESDAMKAVVDDFNASQDRVFVNYLSISQIDRKLMLSIAGGNPPDVAGLWSWSVPSYAENDALVPLDRMAAAAGIRQSDYIDVYWRLCSQHGHLWGLPSAPASTALHWNKKLFREAGLDPERPPRSIAELESFNDKLTQLNADGSIRVLGHDPAEPGWWNACWGYWFGGRLFDGDRTITADCAGDRAAFQWLASYPNRFGAARLQSFHEGFGNFASSQNAFLSGRVAMVLQGVWMYNFIKNYAPTNFEWGVAPFPTVDPAQFPDSTIAECDLLSIPHGARHPKEAFEFIRYVNTQKPMEKLCMGQRKFSPLRACSDEFIRNHPNPYIGEFIRLAKSPNALSPPQIATWTEYRKDMANAVGMVLAAQTTPEEALRGVQEREQRIFDRKYARWKRVEAQRMLEWNAP